MKYRPEIDGLRAVAVIPVILSHAGFPIFSGGFIGVDIFFVISGYLITSIILKEKRDGSFSLPAFYERRVRRIIPPLFSMLVVSAIVAYFTLMPTEMKRFSQSLVAVVFSSSNILFWKTHGYFEPSSDLKPLLHTWSLGVEEQFYFIFPLVFLFRKRRQCGNLSIIIMLLTLFSFIISEFIVKTHPAFSFYSLPTRSWEILIGAFIAVLPRNQNDGLDLEDSKMGIRRIRNEVLGLIGISCVLFSYIIYDNHTPTPSKSSLIPTIGAALILNYVRSDNLVGRLLSLSLLRWVGLLSYSAYLWHQPIFVFARYSFGSRLNSVGFGFLIVLVFIIAYISYRFIEKPCRDQVKVKRWKGGLSLIGVAGLLLAFGFAGNLTKGYPNRLSPKEKAIIEFFDNSLPEMRYFYTNKMDLAYREDCNFYDIAASKKGSATVIPRSTNLSVDCFTRKNPNSRVVFLWGDSHAQQLHSGLKMNMPRDWEILQVASSACHPQIVSESSPNNYCDYSNWFAVHCIINSRPDVVVVSQDKGYSLKNMNAIHNELRRIGVARVVFVGPSPRFLIAAPEILLKIMDDDLFDAKIFLDKNIIEEDLFLRKTLQLSDSFRYVSAVECFKMASQYICVGPISADNLIVFDTDHLTPKGSDYLAKHALVREITYGVK